MKVGRFIRALRQIRLRESGFPKLFNVVRCVYRNAQRSGDSLPIDRIGFQKMANVVQMKFMWRFADRARRVFEQSLLLGAHQFDRESSDVAFSIGRPVFAREDREACEKFGFLADALEYRCLRVFCNVVRHGEIAVGSETFGMHTPLGEQLAVEMGELFQEPDILELLRTGGHPILVIDDGKPGVGGEFFDHDHTHSWTSTMDRSIDRHSICGYGLDSKNLPNNHPTNKIYGINGIYQ